MTILKKSAFARQQGWRPSYITKLIEQGHVVLDGNMVDVEKTLQRIEETKGGRVDVAERNAAQRGAEKQTNIDIPMDQLQDGTRQKYKATTIHFENQLQKLNMALDRGLRFDNRAVRDEALGIGNTLRAAMERLIDTTAPRLAIAKTRDERARILQMEVSAMRKTIKNTFPRAMIRLAKKTYG